MRFLDRLLTGLVIVALLVIGGRMLSSRRPPAQVGASIVVGRVTPQAGTARAGGTPPPPAAVARGCRPATTAQPGEVGAPLAAAPAPPAPPLRAGDRGWHHGNFRGGWGARADKPAKGPRATGKKPTTAPAHGKYKSSRQGRAG
jgi:hypothetical protein